MVKSPAHGAKTGRRRRHRRGFTQTALLPRCVLPPPPPFARGRRLPSPDAGCRMPEAREGQKGGHAAGYLQ